MSMDFTPEQITSYFDLGLLILFIAVIAIFVLGFIRGIFQGWKYGTFKFIFFAILIAAAFFTIKPLGGWIADFNLSSFNIGTISFDLTVDDSTVNISSAVTTVRETGVDIITQIFQAYNVAADPTTVSEYALSIMTSVVAIIALILDAIVITIVGNLLCLILWHALFKWFIPREARKKKNLKVLSGFEQAITSFVVLAMFISPLSGMANNLSRSFERISDDQETSNKVVLDSKIYQTVTGLIDTYDNSLFNKAFFSWYADSETGMRFDESLLTYISTIELSSGETFSIVSELSNVIKVASYAIDSGILGDNGINADSLAIFVTSQYGPKMLRAIGQSKLIQEIAPIAFNIVLNLDFISDYFMTEEGIDTSHYDNAATFNKLADLFQTVVDSGVMYEVIDEETNTFIFDSDHVSNLFSPEYQATFDAVFETLGSSELEFVNDLLTSAIYVQAVKEYKDGESSSDDDITIGIKDFLPELTEEELKCTDEGKPVAIPQSIKDIDFASELQIVFDSLFQLMNVDSNFAPLIFNPLLDEESGGFDQDAINDIIAVVLDNLDDVEKYIDGKSIEEGNKCLLDSTLIGNAVPTFLRIIEKSTNDAIELEGEDAIDVSDIIDDYKAKDEDGRKEAAKEETKSIFNVLRPFASSEEGKALIKDFDNLPGLYFDKDGSFLGAKEGLLTSLAEGLTSIDDSKVFSNMLPTILKKYLTGDDSFLKQNLGLDLTLDFAPKDSSGNSILGHEISKIIKTYAECQDCVTYLMGAFSGSSDLKAMEKALSGVCELTTATGELQLTKLLTAIGESKIFNPVTDDGGTTVYNNSVYNLFKMIFKTAGLLDTAIDTDLKDLIMVETFDVSSETSGLVDLIKYLCENDILGVLSDGLTLDSMANISFEGLFSKVSSSQLLQTVLGDVIDSKLGSMAIFSFTDEGGDTISLSFKNITDWQTEGAALDTMTKYASIVGDITSIDFNSIDPEMVSSVMGYFATSQLFIVTNEDGTHTWLLPKYFASKIVKIAKQAGDLGKFFTDIEETYDGGVYEVEGKDPSLDESYSALKADILAYSVENTNDMSLIEDGQAAFSEEGQRLSEIFRCLSCSGAMNIMSDGVDAKYGDFKTEYFSELLDKMSESILMGRTGITQVLLTVTDILKTSVDAFNHTNVMFAFQTDSVTERKAIGETIVTILECAIDPVSGFLDSDSKIDTTKLQNMNDLDAYHFVSPLLHALNSTEAFTTLSTFQETTAGMTYSTFIGEMREILKTATWYGDYDDIDAVLPIIEAKVEANGGWDAEIDNFVQVFGDFQTMGLDLSSGFSFDGFFKEEGFGEDIISKALIDINKSYLLYPGLPEKLNEAISSLESGSLAGSGISLSNANVYYAGKALSGATPYATNPFDDDECYRLASILGKGSQLGSVDLTDISGLSTEDIENITDLLADFAQSGIFNSLKEGASTSVFQDVMGTVLGGDSLNDYYISSTSPKDLANIANYTTATEKAKYIANIEYPYISNTNSNSDVTNLVDESSPSSLRSMLITLVSDNDFTTALSSGTFDSLNETKMNMLLSALNKCDWTYDIVPNAIADSISAQSLDAVNLRRADPFYQYDYSITYNGTSYENSGTLLGTPNYENRYDDQEIETVAKIVDIVKSNSTLTTDLSSKTKVLELRNFLEALNDSYAFHLAGASYDLEADDNLSEFTLTDLPVFEQAMYNLYKQSGLADLAYNEVYDSSYANYEAKLLDKVKEYPDSDWSNELMSLMVNDTMDEGLFSVAFDLGFVSAGSVSISSSDLTSKSPTEISSLLYAANNVDITQELVAYELQGLINDTINFSVYSKETATYNVGASSFNLAIDNAVYELKITMSSGDAPTVSYGKAGSIATSIPTGSNPYVYTLYDGSTIEDRPLGKDITISGAGTIDKIEVTFTSDKEIGLIQAQYDTVVSGNHVGAINELITIAEECFYDPVTSSYIDFSSDPDALGNLFGTVGNVTKIMSFLKSPYSFFTSSFDSSWNVNGSDFDAGDICTSRMFAFTSGGYSIDLFEYMPDYDASNRVPGYMNIHDVYSQGSISEVTSWIDSHIVEAGAFYSTYKALSSIQLIANYVSSFAYGGESITDYLSDTAGWHTFETAFKTGFANRLYLDMRNAAMSSAHFTGNITSGTLYTLSASDYQGFLELTRNSLIPLLGDLKLTGLSNVTEAASMLNNLASTESTSPYKDVIASYYEQALYEALANNMSSSFLTQPATHSAPFGDSGYLKDAAVILDPSLA